MMNYEYFKAAVVTCVGNYIPEQYKDFELKSISSKNTNEIKDGITLVKINPGKSNISAVVYIDDLYELYRYSNDLTVVLEYAAKFLTEYINNITMPKIELDNVADSVMFQLVNTLRNEELIKKVPSRKFNDLSVIYRWVIGENDEGDIQSVIITNEMAEIIGVDEKQLFKIALKNTTKLFPPVISPIMNMIELFIGVHGFENPEDEAEFRQMKRDNVPDDMDMWVVTNRNNFYAAGLMLCEGLLWQIADNLDSDLYILPSSVNEIVIVKTAGMLPKDLERMVRVVNTTDMVSEKEFLSNHVYCYDRILGKVYIAA